MIPIGFIISLFSLDYHYDFNIYYEYLKKNGVSNCKIEGRESSDWKLVDGIDLIIHIFNPEKRKFYELEKMWSELIPKEKLII